MSGTPSAFWVLFQNQSPSYRELSLFVRELESKLYGTTELIPWILAAAAQHPSGLLMQQQRTLYYFGNRMHLLASLHPQATNSTECGSLSPAAGGAHVGMGKPDAGDAGQRNAPGKCCLAQLMHTMEHETSSKSRPGKPGLTCLLGNSRQTFQGHSPMMPSPFPDTQQEILPHPGMTTRTHISVLYTTTFGQTSPSSCTWTA